MSMPSEYVKYLNRVISSTERRIDALTGVDERLDYTNLLLSRILIVLGEQPPTPATPEQPAQPVLSNPREMASGTLIVPTAGSAVQMPAFPILYGKEVVIKAKAANTGIMYIGNSQQDAQDHSTAFPLAVGEGIGFGIKLLSQLWVDASVGGDGIAWTVEK